jgi:sugar O-acyltransferase (sialic acid O-acetyltransferase NeuD family)
MINQEIYSIVIIGAGGHGREAMDVARDHARLKVAGFVDDIPPSQEMLNKYRTVWLGTVDYLLDKEYTYVIAVGDCGDKEKISARLAGSQCLPANNIHTSASIGSYCTIGKGVMLYQGAVVTTNVTLGDHVHLNVNSVVSHDCRVGDFTTISPGVMLNGNVVIGKGVFIGTGAIILPKIYVGDGAVIGAGAVVTRDVPPYETYIGIPARRKS